MQIINDYFRNADPTAITTYIPLLIIIVLAAGIFLIFQLTAKSREKRVTKLVDQNITTVRIFVLDLQQNRSSFFNRSNIRDRSKHGTLDYFYSQFHNNERKRMRDWIEALMRGDKGTANYIESDVYINKTKQNVLSIIQVLEVNRATGRIYLESHLLRAIAPRHKDNRKARAVVVSEAKARELFTKRRDKSRGCVISLRLYKTNLRQERDLAEEKILLSNMKNRLTAFLNSHRVMINISEMELGIIDIKSIGRPLDLAYTLANEIGRYIDVNGLKTTYSYSMGIMEASMFKGSFSDMLRTVRELAILGENNGEIKSFYDPTNRPQIDKTNNAFTEGLTRLIKNRSFKLFYRPIVDVEKPGVIGHLAYIQPVDSIFNTYVEMKEYALKTNQEHELFVAIARGTIAKFYNERLTPEDRLFFPTLVADEPSINRSLLRISHAKEVKIVLQFSEEDVSISNRELESTILLFNEFKENGFELALVINDSNLILPNQLYGVFDYFIFDRQLTGSLQMKDTRSWFNIDSAIGKLLKYKKPIIVSDLADWKTIERMIESSIRYISAEAIADSRENIYDPDKTKLAKANSYTRN